MNGGNKKKKITTTRQIFSTTFISRTLGSRKKRIDDLAGLIAGRNERFESYFLEFCRISFYFFVSSHRNRVNEDPIPTIDASTNPRELRANIFTYGSFIRRMMDGTPFREFPRPFRLGHTLLADSVV